jgi:hypothetical protein
LRFLKATWFTEEGGRSRIQQHVDAPGTQPGDHGLHSRFHFGKFWFREDTDAFAFHT